MSLYAAVGELPHAAQGWAAMLGGPKHTDDCQAGLDDRHHHGAIDARAGARRYRQRLLPRRRSQGTRWLHSARTDQSLCTSPIAAALAAGENSAAHDTHWTPPGRRRLEGASAPHTTRHYSLARLGPARKPQGGGRYRAGTHKL